MENDTLICYVCRTLIKLKNYIYIGKNFENLKLYRHNKCNPNSLTPCEVNKVKHWKKYPKPILPKKRKYRKRKKD